MKTNGTPRADGAGGAGRGEEQAHRRRHERQREDQRRSEPNRVSGQLIAGLRANAASLSVWLHLLTLLASAAVAALVSLD